MTLGLNRSLAARAAESSSGRISSLQLSSPHAPARDGAPPCTFDKTRARKSDEELGSTNVLKDPPVSKAGSTHPKPIWVAKSYMKPGWARGPAIREAGSDSEHAVVALRRRGKLSSRRPEAISVFRGKNLAAMSVTQAEFRKALGCFATGITV